MIWLPYDRCTLHSPHTVQEVIARLEPHVGEQRCSLFDRPKEIFIGTVGPEGFNMTRNITYRNSFIPQLIGTFAASGTSTVVKLRMRLHPFVQVFSAIWLGGVSLGFITTMITGDFGSALIPFGMFLFFYAMLMIGFRPERKKALEALREVIGAELLLEVPGPMR